MLELRLFKKIHFCLCSSDVALFVLLPQVCCPLLYLQKKAQHSSGVSGQIFSEGLLQSECEARWG